MSIQNNKWNTTLNVAASFVCGAASLAVAELGISLSAFAAIITTGLSFTEKAIESTIENPITFSTFTGSLSAGIVSGVIGLAATGYGTIKIFKLAPDRRVAAVGAATLFVASMLAPETDKQSSPMQNGMTDQSTDKIVTQSNAGAKSIQAQNYMACQQQQYSIRMNLLNTDPNLSRLSTKEKKRLIAVTNDSANDYCRAQVRSDEVNWTLNVPRMGKAGQTSILSL